MTVIVYGLCSTGDGKIRYVGQTTRPLPKRFYYHRKAAKGRSAGKNTYCPRWIRTVWAAGYEVEAFVIEADAVPHQTEQRLIAWYRRHGAQLTNLTDGGEGTFGYRWSPAQIEAISARRKSRVITPEWRQAISDGSRGRPKPEGFGAKLSLARKGMIFTAEHRANISRTSKGRHWQHTEETKSRIAAAKREWWANRKQERVRG